jgi:hypothetical protein
MAGEIGRPLVPANAKCKIKAVKREGKSWPRDDLASLCSVRVLWIENLESNFRQTGRPKKA